MTAGQRTETARTSAGVHRFVVFTTACTFFLLIAGGVPFEYSHGMIAGFVGLLTLAAFRLLGPLGEFAMVPTLQPGPRHGEQSVSVRPS